MSAPDALASIWKNIVKKHEYPSPQIIWATY